MIVFNWLTSEEPGNSNLMISFNLSSDKFQEWQLPNDEKSAYYRCLAVCYDSIALVLGYCFQQYTLNRYVIWTLNEGVWAKRYTINLDCKGYCPPLGQWNDNKVIISM